MIDIPSVIHRDTNGNERAVSLSTRLLQDRIIMATGEITDELAEVIVQQLLYLEAEDPNATICMYCSGPGGSVTAGNSIVDTMDTISCPVQTIVSGQVASMSAVIASCGTKGKRFIYPNARVMLHTVAAGTQGKIQDMEIALTEIARVNTQVLERVAKNCDKTIAIIKKDCDRDFWLSATEAVKYGCCDKIVQGKK